MKPIFSSLQSSASAFMVECLRLRICTDNRLIRVLYDKVINVDLKSVLLEKSLDKVKL